MHKETNEVGEKHEENKKPKKNFVISSSFEGEEEDKDELSKLNNMLVSYDSFKSDITFFRRI